MSKEITQTLNPNSWITNESLGIPTNVENPQPSVKTDYYPDKALNYSAIVRNGVQTSASLNSRNQYTSFGGESLGYDRNGNLISRAGLTLQYDSENHVKKVTRSDGTTVENVYDAQGRKVEEKTSAGSVTKTTDYVLNGDQVIEQYVAGAPANRYVHGRGIDETVRAELDTNNDGILDQTIFPIQDELGNVERLTDQGGSTLERYEYEGYGKFSIFAPDDSSRSSSTLNWNWLFQGREYQPILNAYDFRARDLWPDLGRFGQEDPARASANLNEALNGSPSNDADPLGLYEEDVHNYLTRFIAESVGFSPSVAQDIGRATGLLDFDQRDAMYPATAREKILDAIIGAAPNHENMLKFHFVDSSQLAQLWYGSWDPSRNGRLVALGEYLHAFEDRYSHQQNLRHPTFAREYSDSYPIAGWSGHGKEGHWPDQTWNRIPLAMQMSQDLYDELKLIYRDRHSDARSPGEVPFGEIQSTIENFMQKPDERDLYQQAYAGGAIWHLNVRDYSEKVGRLNKNWRMTDYEVRARQKQYGETRAIVDQRANGWREYIK